MCSFKPETTAREVRENPKFIVTAKAFAWLGLPPEAGWQAVAEAAYARFEDHWAAEVAYHF